MGPAVILVRPQLGENIGMAARAMWNFGLEELRLVAPRDGWPNEAAEPAAAGAAKILKQAKLFKTTGEAMADLSLVYAATARSRGMIKPVLDARAAVKKMRKSRGKAGVLFGRESSGLANQDVTLADAILKIPVNPAFGSLNLSVAVGIVAYECALAEGLARPQEPKDRPAAKREVMALIRHLEEELDQAGYFASAARRKARTQSLRNIVHQAGWSVQQVQTLRGVIKALSGNRKP